MTTRTLALTRKLFSPALLVNLVLIIGLPLQAQALPQSSGNQLSKTTIARGLFDPPGEGKPKDTVGGASRGGYCPQDPVAQEVKFTPLIPQTNYGLTTVAHPTFMAYVPQTSARIVFFSLKDEDGKLHYQTKFALPANPGVVSFDLPENAPALEVGKNYKWSMALICEQHLKPDSPVVGAWIQRIEPTAALTNKLKTTTTPMEIVAAYGAAGVWYDTLQNLHKIQNSQPKDSTVLNAWKELMESAGMPTITSASIVP